MDISDSHTKKAWAVISNTDLTEGRGSRIVLCVCEKEFTAIRLSKGRGVMGADAIVQEVDTFRVAGQWYGPVSIEVPNSEDDREQGRIDRKRRAKAKALSLGMTREDIEDIESGPKKWGK